MGPEDRTGTVAVGASVAGAGDGMIDAAGVVIARKSASVTMSRYMVKPDTRIVWHLRNRSAETVRPLSSRNSRMIHCSAVSFSIAAPLNTEPSTAPEYPA